VTDILKFFGTSRTETAVERSYRSSRFAQRAPKFCFDRGYVAQFGDDVGLFIFCMGDDCSPKLRAFAVVADALIWHQRSPKLAMIFERMAGRGG
jgi:hypothetical protein